MDFMNRVDKQQINTMIAEREVRRREQEEQERIAVMEQQERERQAKIDFFALLESPRFAQQPWLCASKTSFEKPDLDLRVYFSGEWEIEQSDIVILAEHTDTTYYLSYGHGSGEERRTRDATWIIAPDMEQPLYVNLPRKEAIPHDPRHPVYLEYFKPGNWCDALQCLESLDQALTAQEAPQDPDDF